MTTPLFVEQRRKFHAALLVEQLRVDSAGVASNADKDNTSSRLFARGIADALKAEVGPRLSANTSGKGFEEAVVEFLEGTFHALKDLRPGAWTIKRVGGRGGAEISRFAQYAHIAALREAASRNPELAAVLGNEYIISPDVVVIRDLVSDEAINANGSLIDDSVATEADLREREGKFPLLHASVSTKWTIRSDRAQNARSEALNLMRNRKGRQPHIVVVTAEPLPSRLCSIALGTGDIDCVYHFALHELAKVVADAGSDDAKDMLRIMIDGRRLKDISDLPLDLAV